jgi:hypothetical protein
MANGNENIVQVEIIENLLHSINKKVGSLKAKTRGQKTARNQAIDDINYMQRSTLFKLRKEFEDG